MPAITASSLAKTFVTERQAAGLSGSLCALVRPEQQTVEALILLVLFVFRRGLRWYER